MFKIFFQGLNRIVFSHGEEFQLQNMDFVPRIRILVVKKYKKWLLQQLLSYFEHLFLFNFKLDLLVKDPNRKYDF